MGFVYLLFAFPKMAFKIGSSKTPIRRVKDIQKSVNGHLIIPVFVICVWRYEEIEKERLHRIFKKVRFTWKGSGKTEYFKLGLLRFIYCVFLYIVFQIQTAFYIVLIVSAVFLLWFI